MPDDCEHGLRPPSTANAAFHVAWKGAVITFAGLVLLGLESSRKAALRPDPHERGTDRASLGEDGPIVRVSLGVPRGEVSSCLVVQDREGREVAVVHLFADGAFNLESGPEAPVKAVVHAKRDGALRIGASPRGQGAVLVLGVTPDGTSEFEVQDRGPDTVLEHLDITVEGKTMRRPVAPGPAEGRPFSAFGSESPGPGASSSKCDTPRSSPPRNDPRDRP
jgi:hypothetical protein